MRLTVGLSRVSYSLEPYSEYWIRMKPPELVCHLRSSLQPDGDFLLLGHPDMLFLAGDGIDFSIAVITGEGDNAIISPMTSLPRLIIYSSRDGL